MIKQSSNFIILIFLTSLLFCSCKAKTKIEQYRDKIADIQDDINEVNRDIKEYYQKNKKTVPDYVFFDYGQSSELNNLIKEKYLLQIQQADFYNLIGDYYLKEKYLTDKNSKIRYKTKVNIDYLDFDINDDILADLNIVVDTRKNALAAYENASHTVGNYVSDNTKLFSDDLINLQLLDKNNIISKLIQRLKIKYDTSERFKEAMKDRDKRKKYYAERVKASLHHNKGLAYKQLAFFAIYTNQKNILSQEEYLILAEKEFLIAQGADILYHPALYELARIYNYRYEKKIGKDPKYYLQCAGLLIDRFINYEIINDDGQKSSKIKQIRDPKAYFLKGRILYNLGALNEALVLYKDKLLGILPEKSQAYKNAYNNYKRIELELRTQGRTE